MLLRPAKLLSLSLCLVAACQPTGMILKSPAPLQERSDAGVTQPSITLSADAAVPQAGAGKTLRTSGARILDTCGEPWVARGMEQITGGGFAPDGDLNKLAKELVATGSNAVRLLPVLDDVSVSDLETLLSAFASARVVVYISPGDRTWFNRAEVRPVLLKYEKGLILDAFQEPDYNDVPRWLKDTKAAVAQVRSYGFSCPITVLSDTYGRNLSAALEHGQEIVDSDPLHNTIIGWQAYWGESGWYQKSHNMSLTQGVEACAKKGFPMQVGIDLNADPDDPMDYREVMAAAQKNNISWLWWNWWNQWDNLDNNASDDGTMEQLTEAGQVVVRSDVNSIQKTAKKACFR